MIEPNFREILPLLIRHHVRFIVIGGGAAIAHGLARSTYDVDVVYARDPENIRSLVEALRPYHPYLRGAPPGLPFRWDEATVQAGLNFTLTTSLGSLDVLGEVTGGGTYEQLLPFSPETTSFGFSAASCPWSGSSSSSAPPAGPRTWKSSPNSRRFSKNGATRSRLEDWADRTSALSIVD